MDTKTYIIPCPHCGYERRVSFCQNLWTKTNYVFWSDGRIDSDDWYEPMRTQQCPKCGKFFTRDPQGRLTMVDEPCTDRAILSYPQLRVAIKELAGNPYSEEWARSEAWEAFNAFYQNVDNIPKEEQEFNRNNMQWLLGFYKSLSPWRFTDTEFELNRLLGHRDACERMLEITCEEYIQQKKEFRIRRGLPWYDDKEMWTRRYNNLMEELKASLDLPLKPYKRRD